MIFIEAIAATLVISDELADIVNWIPSIHVISSTVLSHRDVFLIKLLK